MSDTESTSLQYHCVAIVLVLNNLNNFTSTAYYKMLFSAMVFALFCSYSSAGLVDDLIAWFDALNQSDVPCLDEDRNCYHTTRGCLVNPTVVDYDRKTTVTNAQCIGNCSSFSSTGLGPNCFYNASIDLANADKSRLDDGGPVTINERCYKTCPEDECYDAVNECYHTERFGCNNWDSDAALEDKTTAVNNTTCIPYIAYRSSYYRYQAEQTIKRAYPNWPNNRCRNTDFHRGGPWCYIKDGKGNPMWANCYKSCSDHEMNKVMDKHLKSRTNVDHAVSEDTKDRYEHIDPSFVWVITH